MSTIKQITILTTALIFLYVGRSYSQEHHESRFGAQQCGYSFGALRELTFQELDNIGIGWGRAINSSDAIRGFIQSGGTFNFQNADFVTGAAADVGFNLIGQLTTQRQGYRNDVLTTLEDIEDFKSYVRMVVERYDGDSVFGSSPGDPLYPDCDLNGDGTITGDERIEWGSTHQFHVWELMKEPVPPERATRPRKVGFTAEQVVTVLRAGWEAIKEADPDAVVLFGGLASTPVGGLEATRIYLSDILAKGGKNYFDILGVDAFVERGDLITDLHREVLDSLGLEKTLWLVQAGTNGGGFGHNPFGGTLKKQAEYVVKSFVQSFAAGAEKVFWGDFVAGKDQWINDPTNPAVWGNYSLLIAGENLVKKRPGFYTYGVMTSRLEGFSSVESIGKNLYKFSFPEKSPVYVLWSEDGDEIIDLSPFIDSSSAKVTHIIVDEGQTEPVMETLLTTAVPVNDSPVFVEEAITTGVDEQEDFPKEFALYQNYPNPFNPQTTIEYQLPFSGRVTLSIYNVLGQEVKTLVDENQSAGSHSVVWDGSDKWGEVVASGIYLFQMRAKDLIQTKKLLLLK